MPESDAWQIERAWAAHDGYLHFRAASRDIIRACDENQSGFVEFPVVFNAIHEVHVDGRLIASKGSKQRGVTGNNYGAPVLMCEQIRGADRLQWDVYASSSYFARLTSMPRITSTLPITSLLNDTIHAVGAALLSSLAIFGIIVLRRKVNTGLLIAFAATGFFWALYCFGCAAQNWGFELTPVEIHHIIAVTNLSGAFGLFSLLWVAGVLHRNLLVLNLLFLLAATPFAVFGSSVDQIQAGISLPFLCYVVTLVSACLISFDQCLKKRTLEAWMIASGLVLVMLSAVNDIAVTTGKYSSIMLVPLGVTILFAVIGLVIHRQIDAVYSERDLAKIELSKAYEERIRIIQEATYSKAVTSAAQMIAHDLKRPFQLLKFALHETTLPNYSIDRLKRILHHIGENFDFVEKLIQDLLVAGRAHALNQEVCELAVTLQEALKLYSNEEFKLQLDLAHTDPLHIDRSKIIRVFHNLLSNAMDATSDRPLHIWVHSKDLNAQGFGFAEITFGNSGSYIAPEDIGAIFSKFRSRGKVHGTGLGLAICHEFVAAHGGSISCQSSIERGTEFIFTLPQTKIS